MKIEHIGVWVKDLEMMRNFYMTYFNISCNEKYVNLKKGFSSYFLSFESGSRIELMHKEAGIIDSNLERGEVYGIAHLAISLGSISAVMDLTNKIRETDLKIIGEPRTTGDGYFESVIEDPEGNWIELTS